MDSTVEHCVRQCEVCARRQGQGARLKAPMTPVPLPERPMDVVGMDICDIDRRPLLVLQDYLSRFLWAFAIPDKKTETVARTLVERFFPMVGAPGAFLSDRGKEFVGKCVTKLREIFGVEGFFTTAYHPQSDGRVERANQTLQACLAKAVAQLGGCWEDHLGSVLYAYNASVHASMGFSPYYCMFGREARRPMKSVMSRSFSGPAPRTIERGDR